MATRRSTTHIVRMPGFQTAYPLVDGRATSGPWMAITTPPCATPEIAGQMRRLPPTDKDGRFRAHYDGSEREQLVPHSKSPTCVNGSSASRSAWPPNIRPKCDLPITVACVCSRSDRQGLPGRSCRRPICRRRGPLRRLRAAGLRTGKRACRHARPQARRDIGRSRTRSSSTSCPTR